LRDVSFEVKTGEVVGVIGRNGSGKSTLLKILSRITEPTEGYAEILGRMGSLLEVGTGFHPELTGRENILLNGAILGMSRKEVSRRFDEIIAFSEIGSFLDTPVKRYSSGMYVRLAFSVAAHLEPDILLVDEVLSVGDLQFQRKCLGRMRDVAGAGRTVLFVSHTMDSVRKLCDRSILLAGGQIVKIGDTDSVIASYLESIAEPHATSSWVRGPGDPWNQHKEFVPMELAVERDNGCSLSSAIGTSQRVWVKIAGEIRELRPNLVVGFALYDSNGTLLFESFQTDADECKWPRLKVGMNVLRTLLPTSLLNAGTYRVELISALHQMHWLVSPGTGPAVRFELARDLSESPYTGHDRRGALVPVLEWELLERSQRSSTVCRG
jgi:lipopolysaccharide transport system ATP-binding protein